MAVEMELQIPAAQTEEPVNKALALRPRLPDHRKMPTTHIGPHPPVIQMLAKTDVHPGRLGTHRIDVQITHRFLSQVQDQINTVGLVGNKADAVTIHQVIFRLVRQLIPLSERQRRKLLQTAFMGRKHALAVQPGRPHIMNDQLRTGPGNQLARLIYRHGPLPGFLRLVGPGESHTQLARDIGHRAAAVSC